MLNKLREFIIKETGGMGPTEEAEKLLNAVDTLENTIHNLTEQLNFYKQESEDQFKGNQELVEKNKKLKELLSLKTCHINGCVNFDSNYENNCSRYKLVECCVDSTPYSIRYREQEESC